MLGELFFSGVGGLFLNMTHKEHVIDVQIQPLHELQLDCVSCSHLHELQLDFVSCSHLLILIKF